LSERVVDKRLLGKPKEKYWVTYIKQRIKKNKNFLGFISGQTGCLDENEEVKILENKRIVYKKLKDLPPSFVVVSYNFGKRKFEFNKASKVDKGLQDCYKISFSDGGSVVATRDHNFFRPNGESISIEKLLDRKERYRLACRNYPMLNENKFFGKTHTKEFLDYKSKLHWKNGIKTYRKMAKKNFEKVCAICGCTDRKLLVHHKDFDRENNILSNLEYVCYSCHTGIIHKINRKHMVLGDFLCQVKG